MAHIAKAPEVRRQELLNTAMELFARQGYEETSMSDIARAAGVAQGLCYRYFQTKVVSGGYGPICAQLLRHLSARDSRPG